MYSPKATTLLVGVVTAVQQEGEDMWEWHGVYRMEGEEGVGVRELEEEERRLHQQTYISVRKM